MKQSDWDENLTEEHARKLNPRNRSRRVLASFERKVELMERWAKDGLPPGVKPKRNRTQLREWYDRAERLWTWTDTKLDHPNGKHGVLYARFAAALKAIDAGRSKKARVAAGRTSVDVSVHQAVVLQCARLQEEVIALKRRIADLLASKRGSGG